MTHEEVWGQVAGCAGTVEGVSQDLDALLFGGVSLLDSERDEVKNLKMAAENLAMELGRLGERIKGNCSDATRSLA